MRYAAFISYNHRDRAFATWLQKRLETYRIPRHLRAGNAAPGGGRKALAPVFRDRSELAASPDLSEQVTRALRESETLIVVCSPHSAASRWVDQEVLMFKRLGRAARIRCVIADTPGSADWAPLDCFCPALRYALDDDGQPGRRLTGEPLAADLRPDQDGRGDGFLKLVAGMLDVGFDDLKRRELRRRRQRTVAAAVLAGVLAAAVIAALWQTGRMREAQRQAFADRLSSLPDDLQRDHPVLASQVLLEAHRLNPSPEARVRLTERIRSLMRRGVMRVDPAGGDTWLSPPNGVAYVARGDLPGERWRLRDAQRVAFDGPLRRVTFSADAQQRLAFVQFAGAPPMLTRTGATQPVIEGRLRGAALGTSRLVVDHGDGHAARLRSLDDLALVAELPAALRSFTFSPDPRQRFFLAAGDPVFGIGDRRLELRDSHDGRLITHLSHAWLEIAEYARFVGDAAAHLAVQFTELPELQLDEGGVAPPARAWRVYRSADGEPAFDLPPDNEIDAFAPGGHLLVVRDDAGGLQVRRVADGSPLELDGDVRDVFFGRRYFIVAYRDALPTVHASEDGRRLSQLPLASRRMVPDRVWFAPDGAHFLVSYVADARIGDYPAQLWDARAGRVVAQFDAATSRAEFAVSGGEHFLLTQASRGRRELLRIGSDAGPRGVRNVFFAPDYRIETYPDRPAALILADGSRVDLGPGVERVVFSDDRPARFFLAESVSPDGTPRSRLWRAGVQARPLGYSADAAMVRHFDAHRLLLEGARGLELVDLAWLEAQAALGERAPLPALVESFCARPWLDAVLDRVALADLLRGQEPRVCAGTGPVD